MADDRDKKPEIVTPETHGQPGPIPEEYGAKPAVNEKPQLKRIKVRSNLVNAPDGGARIALSEKHPDHPDGEVFIAGPGEFEVANTPGVNTAIREGRLAPV